MGDTLGDKAAEGLSEARKFLGVARGKLDTGDLFEVLGWIAKAKVELEGAQTIITNVSRKALDELMGEWDELRGATASDSSSGVSGSEGGDSQASSGFPDNQGDPGETDATTSGETT